MTALLDWDCVAAGEREGVGREEDGAPVPISLRSLPRDGRVWFCFALTQLLSYPPISRTVNRVSIRRRAHLTHGWVTFSFVSWGLYRRHGCGEARG